MKYELLKSTESYVYCRGSETIHVINQGKSLITTSISEKATDITDSNGWEWSKGMFYSQAVGSPWREGGGLDCTSPQVMSEKPNTTLVGETCNAEVNTLCIRAKIQGDSVTDFTQLHSISEMTRRNSEKSFFNQEML